MLDEHQLSYIHSPHLMVSVHRAVGPGGWSKVSQWAVLTACGVELRVSG